MAQHHASQDSGHSETPADLKPGTPGTSCSGFGKPPSPGPPLSQTPSDPRVPRGAGQSVLASPHSPGRGEGVPGSRGCGLPGGRWPRACSERAGPGGGGGRGGGGSGPRRRRALAGPGGAAQSSRSCARTAGARPCPQVAGSRAPRRLLRLAVPRAHPAAVAGLWDAHPADTHPRCEAGPRPLAPWRDRQSLASVSSAKSLGWKMWQPATERLQVRGTGRPGASLEEEVLGLRSRGDTPGHLQGFAPKQWCRIQGLEPGAVSLTQGPG